MIDYFVLAVFLKFGALGGRGGGDVVPCEVFVVPRGKGVGTIFKDSWL